MRVLVACEFSGIVRQAFVDKGHYAVSCDLENSERVGEHYTGDVREILNDGWDLMIAHPPCTYLANSGVSWLYTGDKVLRWHQMERAARFFKELLEAPIERICVENPVMHSHAMSVIRQQWDQKVDPYWFGHTEQKQTCLWLKNLPHLVATDWVYAETMALPINKRHRSHYMPGDDMQGRNRSRTYTGLAAAMAEQWGDT